MSHKIVMNPSPTLGVQLEDEDYRAIDDHAWQRRISKRQLVRDIMSEWLSNHPRPVGVPQKEDRDRTANVGA